MKICHLTSVHQRYDTRILYKQCASLARSGFRVTLIVADGKPEETIQDVRIISACAPATSRLLRAWSSARAVYQEALRQDAALYHIHDPELLPFALALKKRGKRVIFDSHEDIPLDILTKKWIPTGLRHLTSFSYENYEKHVIKYIDAVITVTPHIAERFQRYTPNVHMITNYPDVTCISAESRFLPEETPPTLCFTGLVSPLWRHETILDAMRYISDAIYLLAGSASPTYISKLSNHESWPRVQYHGLIPRQQALNLFSLAHVGVAIVDYSPAVGGTQGTLGNNKLFEYMSYGLPVVCTDMTLWKEIIDQWNCGITVSAEDPLQIAQAIRFIYEHPEIALSMGRNGIEAVKRNFNWQNQEKRLLEIYENLLSTSCIH